MRSDLAPSLPVVALAAAFAVVLAAALAPAIPLGAQEVAATAPAPAPLPEAPRDVGEREQRKFENVRRMNLPDHRGRVPRRGECQEPVGTMCYWYDEKETLIAPERDIVSRARATLVAILDSLAVVDPGDPWIAGQRVRYTHESGRLADVTTAANACQGGDWWCDALRGFAHHVNGRYVEAEATFDSVLTRMGTKDRCDWRDLTPYLDDDTRRAYNRTRCGEAARDAFESRVWWFSRTRYGMKGNDSRSEHFARLVYLQFLRDAPSAFRSAFNDAELEILQRFGWPVAWASGGRRIVMAGETEDANVIGIEAHPAYRLIPPNEVLGNPSLSDSTQWALQRPPVVARYHPPYALRLLMLEHQQALFRRGDTALVALAYDVSRINGVKGPLDVALVLTPGTPGRETRAYGSSRAGAPARGTMTVRAPWGPLLMSAEVEDEASGTLVRARYGIQPPFAVRSRVVISDLLFFKPYGDFPTTVEEALPHALTTQRVRSSEPLGVFWEAYNTNPAGEKMTVALTVVPETDESGFLARSARALRLAKEATPVSVGVEDISARGASVSPRALTLDIRTLKKGSYLVQLEITVAGQYTIRADRRIVVTGP